MRCAAATFYVVLVATLPLSPLGAGQAEEYSALAYAPSPARTPNPEAVEAIQRAMLGGATADSDKADLPAPHVATPDLTALAPIPATMPPSIARRREAMVPEIPRYGAADRRCLAIAIYFEARGESRQGQAAVAQVVLNRARSGTYPKSVCGVVYQNRHRRHACQFSFACDGIPDRIREPKAWATAKRIADEVASGRIRNADLATATHYHASYVSPGWGKRMKRLTRIGRHVFYHEKGRLL